MSLVQPQESTAVDIIPSLPRPSSILQKQSSFTKGSKRALPSSEANCGAVITTPGFTESKPINVVNAVNPRNNPAIDNRSKVSPLFESGQDAEAIKKLPISYPASVPPQSAPIPRFTRAPVPSPALPPAHLSEVTPTTASLPLSLPARAPETASVPAHLHGSVPARAPETPSASPRAHGSVPARAPENPSASPRAHGSVPARSPETASVPSRAHGSQPSRVSAKKTTHEPAKKKLSAPKSTQRTITRDSTSQRLSKERKSQEPGGVRCLSDVLPQPEARDPKATYSLPAKDPLSCNNSLGPAGFGSFCYGMGSMGPIGYQNPFYGGSMYGLIGSTYGSMGPRQLSGMGSFMYRGMEGGMPGCAFNLYPSTYGSFRYLGNPSMDPMRMGSLMGSLNGSFYEPRGFGSILNSSMYDNPYMDNGSFKLSIARRDSGYGIAAQWSSLANMSGMDCPQERPISSYGGLEPKYSFCIENQYLQSQPETCAPIRRSGRRGGHSCTDAKSENPVRKPINSEIDIKRATETDDKRDGPSSMKQDSSAFNLTAKTNGASHNPRAAVPTSHDVHTLLIVDKGARNNPDIVVSDPNTVVLQKNGRSETFECDEALKRTNTSGEVDSVLFSYLRSNWLAGHCSAILVCAGKGKDKDAICIAHNMVMRCLERLEKAPVTSFDVTITMCQLRGANQGLDLLNGSTSYENLKQGSHPVYGPCLLGVTTIVVQDAKDCVDTLKKGIAQARGMDEIVVAFLVLKTVRKSSSGTDVFLSSLCIAYFHEEAHHIIDLKDKSSISPHRVFRYAVGGACVCVSMVVLDENDTNALGYLEAQRKVREVKNKPPRSGNVRRFIEFTDKEIAHQKEKLGSSSGTELSQREMQIKRMEQMSEDSRAILNDPEHSQPKGYMMS